MRFAALTPLLLGAALSVTAQNASPDQVKAILTQVEGLTTNVERFNFFNGRDYVFDFNQGTGTTGGAGGNLTIANVADFPYLYGKGMALSVGRLGPCGLAPPHYHPRASEFLYMLSGSNLQVGFILENGARLVQGSLNPGQGWVYPKNSFHFQSNIGCEPVTFVAGWNHEDPGIAHVAQRFFGIPPNVTDADIGNIGVDEVVRIAQLIPDAMVLGVQSCLDRCKIQRGNQPKTQQQPRVLGNGFPAPNSTRREVHEMEKRSEVPVIPDVPEAITRSSSIPSFLGSANAQTLEEIAFLLKAVICVLLSGYVLAWVYFVIPSWRNRRLQAELAARGVASAPIDVKA